jgi:hypothetical protein
MPSSTSKSFFLYSNNKSAELKSWLILFYNQSISPFYESLTTFKQIIVVLTGTLAVPYLLRGHIVKLLELIKGSVQGLDISIASLASLLTETFLIIYVASLFISFKTKSSTAKTTIKPEYTSIDLSFTSQCVVPNYLTKVSSEQPSKSRFSPQRFKQEFDITKDDGFNNILQGIYETKLTGEDVKKFTSSNELFSNSSLKGFQSKIYEALNPTEDTNNAAPVKTMSLLDFLNEEEATQPETI